MPDLNDPLWGTGEAGLITRVRELEGLLAGVTRQLEEAETRAADAEERRPTLELGELTLPEHLARIDDAAQAVAERVTAELANLTPEEVATLAGAISSLAVARDRLSAKPLPAIAPFR